MSNRERRDVDVMRIISIYVSLENPQSRGLARHISPDLIPVQRKRTQSHVSFKDLQGMNAEAVLTKVPRRRRKQGSMGRSQQQ